MSQHSHPAIAPIMTVLEALEAVLDDQASVAIVMGATPAEQDKRNHLLAKAIEANTRVIDDALPAALRSVAGLDQLLLAIHGDADVQMPNAIRPLSWLSEMIKDVKERGPAPSCDDQSAFWEMVREVEGMHARATAAVEALRLPHSAQIG